MKKRQGCRSSERMNEEERVERKSQAMDSSGQSKAEEEKKDEAALKRW